MTFLFPLIGLVGGIIASAFADGALWSLVPVGLALLTYYVILKKSRLPLAAMRLNKAHAIWIVMLFFGVGMAAAWYHRPATLDPGELRNYVHARGEVVRSWSYSAGDRYLVDITHATDGAGHTTEFRNLTIELQTDGFSADRGDIIDFPLRLRPVEDDRNHRPSGHAQQMKRQGVRYHTDAKFDEIRMAGHISGIRSKSAAWRDRIEATIEKSSLERSASEFIISILLGDRSFISTEVKDSFSNAGVAHVLALSGMHVAIIMGIFLALLYPVKMVRLERMRYLMALVLVWGYAFLTGLAPSTVRACVMTSFMVISICLQRRRSSANALLASAFVILLFDPAALFDAGMQLSFLCVACILAFAGPLNTVNRHLHPHLHSVTSAVLVSMVASFGSWVLVSYYFKRIPLLFLPANLLILPLLPAYMLLAIIFTSLCCLGIDVEWLSVLLEKIYEGFVWLTREVASLGTTTIDYQATLPGVCVWILGLLIAGYAIRKGKKWLAAGVCGMMAAGVCVIALFLSASQPDSVIFQRNYHDMSLAIYEKDRERISKMPRNAVSAIAFGASEILTVDCCERLDTLATLMATRKRKKRNYLLLGSGFEGRSLSQIPGFRKFDKIILHSSIKPKNESAIIEEARALGLTSVHSIREDGPLEVEL